MTGAVATETVRPTKPKTLLLSGLLWKKFAGPGVRDQMVVTQDPQTRVRILALPTHGPREGTHGASFSSRVEWGSQLNPLL